MFEQSSCEVIVGRCYNLSFDYENGLKNYLDTNYTGTYQCLNTRPHVYQSTKYDDEDSQEGNMFVTMRNVITNEIIEMELYNDRFLYPNLFHIKITPEIRELLQYRHHNNYSTINVYPSIRDRGEEIFKILIAEQQMEDEVSPNLKQVIQNSDLNRYLMGFI
jgi:hypothetical protein